MLMKMTPFLDVIFRRRLASRSRQRSQAEERNTTISRVSEIATTADDNWTTVEIHAVERRP